ncbi:hypothetical protein [Rhodoferax ferrireducens]|uniref:hypothetical protein n=1 Tax=Rhodoferax ferrireducens TaxID=192843 RepID=UPI000E0D908E|nr:hypothetical protein [Rhodoferax ferrireducens]
MSETHNTQGLPGRIYARTQKLNREQIADARKHSSALATGVKICNSNTPDSYRGDELGAPATRPGADNHQALPSRIGEQLIYRSAGEVAA